MQAVIIEEKDTKSTDIPKIQSKANEVLGGKLSSFEAFKRQKLAEKATQSGGKNNIQENQESSINIEQNLESNSANQQKIDSKISLSQGLNEFNNNEFNQTQNKIQQLESSGSSTQPLEVFENEIDNSSIKRVTVSSEQLNSAIKQFISTQGARVSSALKLLTYSLTSENSLKIVLGSKAQEGLIEEVRASLIQFLNKNLPVKVTGLETELAELENTERRPYTDREKLEYLTKKHPLLAKTIEDLQLRIP